MLKMASAGRIASRISLHGCTLGVGLDKLLFSVDMDEGRSTNIEHGVHSRALSCTAVVHYCVQVALKLLCPVVGLRVTTAQISRPFIPS